MTARREAPSAAVRIRAMKRDRFRCTYCGVPGTDAELEIDHIVAVSKGGSHHISNLTTACRACNQKKGAGDAPERITSDMAASGGIEGMLVHTFTDDGLIQFQGRIVGLCDDMALLQLYSWFDGSETKVKAIPKSELFSDRCAIYRNHEAFHYAYQDYCRDRRNAGDPAYADFRWQSYQEVSELAAFL